jgi:enterochelin esterase-like enzyme
MQTRFSIGMFLAGLVLGALEYPGLSHEWQSWRKQLNDFTPLLFRW